MTIDFNLQFRPFSDPRTPGVTYSGAHAHREDFDFWLERAEILRSDIPPADKARALARLGHVAGDIYEMLTQGLSESIIDPRDAI